MTKRFTLIEVLTVTGMIAIVVALVIVGYNGIYRSWSSRNTMATMKSAQLALDKYRLENGSFPVYTGKLEVSADKDDPELAALANDLLQTCAPYSEKDDDEVRVFDDFGKKEPLRYVFPYGNTKTFALFSAGKDGEFNKDEDDIVFLPAGLNSLPPGFYMVKVNADWSFSSDPDDIEPLAQ